MKPNSQTITQFKSKAVLAGLMLHSRIGIFWVSGGEMCKFSVGLSAICCKIQNWPKMSHFWDIQWERIDGFSFPGQF